MKVSRNELREIILEEVIALVEENPELLNEVSWLRRLTRSVGASGLAKKLRQNWDSATLSQMDDVDAVVRGEEHRAHHREQQHVVRVLRRVRPERHPM